MPPPSILALSGLPIDPRVEPLVEGLQRKCGRPLLVELDPSLPSDRVEYGWSGPAAPHLRLPVRLDDSLRVVGPLLWLSLAADGFATEVSAAEPVGRELAILLTYHAAWLRAVPFGVTPSVYLPGSASSLLYALAAAVDQQRGVKATQSIRTTSAFALSPSCRIPGIRWPELRLMIARDLGRDFVDSVEFSLNIAGANPRQFDNALAILCREFGVPVPDHRCPVRERDAGELGLIVPERIFGFIEGNLATTHQNAKGRAFTVDDLVRLLSYHETRPLMYHDHDMSKRPVLRVVAAHLHCLGEHHEVHAKMAVLTSEHAKLLADGRLRGFSSGVVLPEDQ